jgi:lipopolysaccharide transport system ATP-binding protein
MVRLAFAVAAHLNPQILIADEVLAVGDQAFQKKCLGKMKDVAGHGRTVLFVSHNMSAVQTLCSRGIVLQNGRIHIDADVSEAISAYLRTHPQVAAGQHFDNDNRPGVGHIRLCKVETYVDGLPSTQLQSGCNVRWVFQFNRIVPKMDCIVTLYDQGDRPVAQFHSGLRSPQDTLDPEIGSAFECEVEELPLVPGIYRMDVRIVRGPVLQDYVETAMVFDVEPGRINGRRTPDNNEYGNVLLPHRWNCGLPD